MNEDLAAEIASVLLTPVRLSTGYEMAEVDDFLDDLAVAVTEGGSVRALVDAARFTPTRLREGYSVTEVEQLLDRIASEVDRRIVPSDPSTGSAPPPPVAEQS